MDKRQVVVIHGGESFDTYEDYIAWLEKQEAVLFPEERKGWRKGLQEALGEGYEVVLMRMPNGQNAKYREWKLWFDKHVPLLAPEIILVGHSLGGVFLAKYLDEVTLPRKIIGVFLVAAPYGNGPDYSLADFALTGNLQHLWAQCGNVFLYHSTDDPIVPFSDLAAYQAQLPFARASIYADRGHFLDETFPELVADIRSLG